jgi:copper(I)-binding protein
MLPRRTLGAAVIAVLPLVAGCGEGRNTTTDKEHQTPYVVNASAGSLFVTGAILVPAQAGTSDTTGTASTVTPTPSASAVSTATPAATADGYLLVDIVNRGTTPDQLTGVLVEGASVTPADESPQGLTLPPSQAVHFDDPELGGTGNSLQVSGLSQPLTVGSTVPVTLRFQQAGSVTLQVPVRASDGFGTTATSTPLPLTGSYPSSSETPEGLPTGG